MKNGLRMAIDTRIAQEGTEATEGRRESMRHMVEHWRVRLITKAFSG
jgi:hypothetical protein